MLWFMKKEWDLPVRVVAFLFERRKPVLSRIYWLYPPHFSTHHKTVFHLLLHIVSNFCRYSFSHVVSIIHGKGLFMNFRRYTEWGLGLKCSIWKYYLCIVDYLPCTLKMVWQASDRCFIAEWNKISNFPSNILKVIQIIDITSANLSLRFHWHLEIFYTQQQIQQLLSASHM